MIENSPRYFPAIGIEKMRDGLFDNRRQRPLHTDHFRSDFNNVENLSRVDSNRRANHFREDGSVTQVSLEDLHATTSSHISLLQERRINSIGKKPLEGRKRDS